MSYPACDVAKYIIKKCEEMHSPISNMQLQLLLYIVQKEFLSCGSEAFPEEIEAWVFGPVVPSVYYQYCGFAGIPIRMYWKPEAELDKDFVRIVDSVIVNKSKLPIWGLVKEVNTEGGAWDVTYKNGEGNHSLIRQEVINKECFKEKF